jgi:hypothetical protein
LQTRVVFPLKEVESRLLAYLFNVG